MDPAIAGITKLTVQINIDDRIILTSFGIIPDIRVIAVVSLIPIFPNQNEGITARTRYMIDTAKKAVKKDSSNP